MKSKGTKINTLCATSVQEDGQSRIVFVEVPGYAKGFLSVHKVTEKLSPDHVGEFRITHTATGYQVRRYDSEELAYAVRDAILAAGIDWEFTDPRKGITKEVADKVKKVEEEVKNAQPLEDAIAPEENPDADDQEPDDDDGIEDFGETFGEDDDQEAIDAILADLDDLEI